MLKKFKEQATKITQFFRLTDDRGLLSLTNITMMIVMYKLALTPSLSFTDLTALALGVLSYQGKRMIEK